MMPLTGVAESILAHCLSHTGTHSLRDRTRCRYRHRSARISCSPHSVCADVAPPFAEPLFALRSRETQPLIGDINCVSSVWYVLEFCSPVVASRFGKNKAYPLSLSSAPTCLTEERGEGSLLIIPQEVRPARFRVAPAQAIPANPL